MPEPTEREIQDLAEIILVPYLWQRHPAWSKEAIEKEAHEWASLPTPGGNVALRQARAAITHLLGRGWRPPEVEA